MSEIQLDDLIFGAFSNHQISEHVCRILVARLAKLEKAERRLQELETTMAETQDEKSVAAAAGFERTERTPNLGERRETIKAENREDLEWVDNIFAFHASNDTTRHLHASIRQTFGSIAHSLIDLCPRTPERTLAIRKLQEAMWAANSVIACTVPEPANESPKLDI